jgi:hypothetical protein
MSNLLARAVAASVADPANPAASDAADAVLRIASELGVEVDVARPQELVYDALVGGRDTPAMRRLGSSLHLAVDRLS